MSFPALFRMLRRGRRTWGRLLGRRGPDFVYSRRYQLDLQGTVVDPLRGERILSFLDASGLLSEDALHTATPASFRHLRRVHTDDYLDSLNQPGALISIMGLSISDELTQRILESQRFMVGGTLHATALALGSKGVAVNLGGGLHHGFAGKGERFCAFNDVAVAIHEVRARGFTGRILVVDLDLHDGDGTRSIFAEDPTVHTFSIHNLTTSDERGRQAVAATVVELPGEVADGVYLDTLRSHLPPVFASVRPDLIFYLAGCDPAAGDAIGNWKISPDAMLERDLFVAGLARGGSRKPPTVILLAGGYGHGAWRYSARFFSALLNQGQPLDLPDHEESTLLRYRRVAQETADYELTGEKDQDDWGLTADDILPMGAGLQRPTRFLSFYTPQGLELALERSGLLDRLRSRGFTEPTLELELGNPAGDTVRVYGDRGDRGHRELLIESRLRVDRREIPGLSLLRIEWLLLQDPRVPFTPERPRLPGQKHPGLGLLPDIVALLIVACDRLQLDGLLLMVPSHYHTASQSRKHLRFIHPEMEALVQAVQKALAGLSLSAASRALAEGRLVDAVTGEPFVWRPMPMVIAVSEALRGHMNEGEYQRKVAEAAGSYGFRLVET